MKTDKFSIVQGDCFDLIKEIKTNTIDLILTDPPYNLANYSTGNIKFDWRRDINNDIAEWDKKDIEPEKIADEFVRVLKRDGNLFVFCSYNLIGKWHNALDPKFEATNFFVWHKTNPVPKFFKNGFLNSCEVMLCCWNKKHKWNFTTQKEMHNFFETPICSSPERLKAPKHPTQKPVKLLEHIIKIASNENDTVFDPFMGVASTGVAALNLNRKFVGIELEENYFAASKDRLVNWEK